MIHLSDLHIGLSEKEAENTKLIFQWIAANYPGRVVLITGDLTNSADEEELLNTAILIERLAATNRVLIVPGNHDYAWQGNVLRPDGWEKWQKALGERFGGTSQLVEGLSLTIIDQTAYFAVDSGDPRDKEISARGYISEALAQALRRALPKFKGLNRVVLLHHHPFDSGFFTKLDGAKAFLSAVIGNSEILLFGHEHHFATWKRGPGDSAPLIVASHKSTDEFGACLLVGFVEPGKVELRPVPTEL